MKMESVNQNTRMGAVVQPGAAPLDAFNPLLRSLVSWELVKRQEDGEGGHSWILIDEVQRRLDSLTAAAAHSTATLAYLDHRCSQCGHQRLTHLRDALYLCVECERVASTPVTTAPESVRAHRSHELIGRLAPRRA